MIILIFFAFLAGIVTILSPCILPVLPIVLSGSVGEGKRKPFGIVTGFVASFTFFTLFLTLIVRLTGVSSDAFRSIAIVVVFGFGLTLLIPKFQLLAEKLFSFLTGFAPHKQTKTGFIGGFLIGVSLGLVWTPCVGPILASVISLALIGSVTIDAFFVTLAYALGTAIPMLILIITGRRIFKTVPWLLSKGSLIQRGFGIVMIATAVALFFQVDRTFQTWVLSAFPSYGANLTKIEEVSIVHKTLERLKSTDSSIKNSDSSNSPTLRSLGQAPELVVGGRWFNSDPLTLEKLRGKVVLIDFWTYTCINCIRTLPTLKIWDEKYRDKGLVIIGVHSPEFEFEKNAENVAKAIKDFDLKYPVMQDNDFATWRAYNNSYWPAKYFIDKDGQVRWTHFGEGNEDESERVIQKLLDEAGVTADMPIANPGYQITARTPELYIGSNRYQNGYINFSGKWTDAGESRSPVPGSSLTLKFNAQQVFLVMRSSEEGGSVHVLLDGQAISADESGEDVHDGIVTVDADRLYQLVKLQKSGDHALTLEFPDGRIELFAFTFG